MRERLHIFFKSENLSSIITDSVIEDRPLKAISPEAVLHCASVDIYMLICSFIFGGGRKEPSFCVCLRGWFYGPERLPWIWKAPVFMCYSSCTFTLALWKVLGVQGTYEELFSKTR